MPIVDLAAPPAGWFLAAVARKTSRKWDWVAAMVNVDPALFPHGNIPATVPVHSCWVRIPGKHRNMDAALDAFQAMIATQH